MTAALLGAPDPEAARTVCLAMSAVCVVLLLLNVVIFKKPRTMRRLFRMPSSLGITSLRERAVWGMIACGVAAVMFLLIAYDRL